MSGCAAYDADLVIKVTSSPRDSPECVGEFAVGKSFIFEPLTQRPIFGQVRMCRAQPSNFLPNTLQFVVHEFLHILVRCAMYMHARPKKHESCAAVAASEVGKCLQPRRHACSRGRCYHAYAHFKQCPCTNIQGYVLLQ